MKKSLLAAWVLGVSLLAPQFVSAQVISSTPKKPVAQYTEAELKGLGQGVAFPYEFLDEVLQKVVSKEGDVHYVKAKGDNDLEVFARAVALADLGQFPSWKITVDANPDKPLEAPKTIDDKRPLTNFWINAYNALFIKTIADAYPVESLSDIKDLDTAKTHEVGGQKYSFAEMRKIIADLDTRALFALNSGTRNGPRVQQNVFRFSTLDPTLDQVVRAYVTDTTKVALPERAFNGRVEVSPWLKEMDPLFKGKRSSQKYEGIRTFLAGYSAGSQRSYFATGNYTIDFIKPVKGLNDQASKSNVGLLEN